jgi:hypothetical protein
VGQPALGVTSLCTNFDATHIATLLPPRKRTKSKTKNPKSDSAAADFTKVRFSGPEVQVQFRVGLRSPSSTSSPIRVGPRSPSPSPSPIRVGLRSPSPRPKSDSAWPCRRHRVVVVTTSYKVNALTAAPAAPTTPHTQTVHHTY